MKKTIGFKISFWYDYTMRCLSFYGDDALQAVFLLKDILKDNKTCSVIEEIYENDKN